MEGGREKRENLQRKVVRGVVRHGLGNVNFDAWLKMLVLFSEGSGET